MCSLCEKNSKIRPVVGVALALAEPVASLTSSVDGLITAPITKVGDDDTERLLNKKTSETNSTLR